MGLLIFDRCILQTSSDEAGGDELPILLGELLTLSSQEGPKTNQFVQSVTKSGRTINPSSKLFLVVSMLDVGGQVEFCCVELHSDTETIVRDCIQRAGCL